MDISYIVCQRRIRRRLRHHDRHVPEGWIAEVTGRL